MHVQDHGLGKLGRNCPGAGRGGGGGGQGGAELCCLRTNPVMFRSVKD